MFSLGVNAQVKQNNGNTLGTATNSSAALDMSSTPSWNSSTNQGKGIIYPRVALSTFTSFSTSGAVGIPNNYPTRFDGFLVYNTDTVGVAGVGSTQGTLKSGYWYYDNKTTNINGGTWRPVSSSSLAPGTNSGDVLTWNGTAWVSQAPAATTTASNGLNMSGSDVRLGGSLTQATTIGTSPTNTLSITGLQSGNLSTDSVLVTTSTGQLKKVSISAVQDHTVGTIVTFPYSAIPADYLECNGAAVSRTTYAALFAKIGTTYGAGDGSTTFNLPDLRGEFIRGWDNGRGVDPSRLIGSNQMHSFASHNHGVNDPGHSHQLAYEVPLNILDTDRGVGNGSFWSLDNPAIPNTHVSTTNISIQNTGGSETRPRNVAMVYAIKANESILLPTNAAISAAAAANEPWYSETTGTGATLNTENIYQTGNVGIGTTAPTTKLHVNAATAGTGFRLVDGSQAAGKVLTSDANGNASWTYDATSKIRVAATGLNNTAGGTFISAQTNLVYTSELQDDFNAYNNSTGVFTAPFSTFYTFEIATYTNNPSLPNTNNLLDINVSGASTTFQYGRTWEKYSDAGGNWYLCQGTNTIYLSAGQTVNLLLAQDVFVPAVYTHTIGLNRLIIRY